MSALAIKRETRQRLVDGHHLPARPLSGRARIVRDSKLLESMAIGRREPRLATVVQVERVFMHSPKCMIRSQIWKSEAWPDSEGLAHIGEAMIAHADLDVTPDELFAEVARAGLTDLY